MRLMASTMKTVRSSIRPTVSCMDVKLAELRIARASTRAMSRSCSSFFAYIRNHCPTRPEQIATVVKRWPTVTSRFTVQWFWSAIGVPFGHEKAARRRRDLRRDKDRHLRAGSGQQNLVGRCCCQLEQEADVGCAFVCDRYAIIYPAANPLLLNKAARPVSI